MAGASVAKQAEVHALQRARYRIGQFVRGWRASVGPSDLALVHTVLSPPAAALFAQMPSDAQAHSLRVLRQLQAQGQTSPDLAAAALLHDVGKVAALNAGAYLGLWLRGPLVLIEAWQPDWLEQWASPVPAPTLRYALYVHIHHPQIGARWAAERGCTAATCWLIEHHQPGGLQPAGPQTPPSASLADKQWQDDLARLQWADGRN